MTKKEVPDQTTELAASAAIMAEAMREMTAEIKLIHNTLKALARSQALIATQAQRKSNQG